MDKKASKIPGLRPGAFPLVWYIKVLSRIEDLYQETRGKAIAENATSQWPNTVMEETKTCPLQGSSLWEGPD